MSTRRVLRSISNGRFTYRDLGRPNSYEVAKPQIAQSNSWSSTENNSNNSWNVNFSDGNTNNNNNKYNSNVVRPCVACDYSTKEGLLKTMRYSDYCRSSVPDAFMQSIIDAYEDCKKGKTSSHQCQEYMGKANIDLPILAYEVWSDTYKPSTSTCFLVNYPKWREVFAANFRDRIIHHWLCNYINHLFESRFWSQGNVSFNCRTDFGTDKAVLHVYDGIKRVSDNYNKEAWVFRGDLVGFFMSIDKDVMWYLMERFLRRRYRGPYKDIILRVAKTIIYHRPDSDCVFNSDIKLWQNLTTNKSLLRTPRNKGMPIGNLTTQLFANFYMSYFDVYVEYLFRGENYSYTRFVDDFVIVCDSKKAILNRVPKMQKYLEDVLKVKMHKSKYYFQPTAHGIFFVGSFIKNGRLYLSNRTLARMCERVTGFNALARSRDLMTVDCERIQQVMNSYFGFCKSKRTYIKKRKLIGNIAPEMYKYLYIRGDCKYINIRDSYKKLKVRI